MKKCLISLCILLCGCNFSDHVNELPNKYVFYSEGQLSKTISKNINIQGKKNINVQIPNCVVNYIFDNKFILALQIPIIDKGANTYYDDVTQYNSGKLNYWIIEAEKDRLYGPLSKDSFFYYRRVLSISDNLKLDTVIEKIDPKQNQ